MGKFPASLLSIVFYLYLIEVIVADEQVLKAQEELRKRHLFFGSVDGEVTPALSAAISAYQKKKGFVPTGQLDLETCASLGLMQPSAKAIHVDTPLVFANGDELRGPNGEALPNSVAANRGTDQPYVELTPSAPHADAVAVAAAGDDITSQIKERQPARPRSRAPPHGPHPHKEANPFVSIFQSVDHAFKLLVGDTQPRKKHPAPNRL